MENVAILFEEKSIVVGMQQVKLVGHAVPIHKLKIYKTQFINVILELADYFKTEMLACVQPVGNHSELDHSIEPLLRVR